MQTLKKRQPFFCGLLFLCMALCFFSLQHCSDQHSGYGSDSTYVIRIAAIPGLRFDTPRFQVPPGAQVKIVLVNEDDMDHNMVITRPGKRTEVVQRAQALGAEGPRLHYIPDGQDVMWKITSVRPGDSEILLFNAPRQAGVYPYVCTYPGHGATMYGAMYVGDKALPALIKDPNIPPSGKQGARHAHQQGKPPLHPYNPDPPYLMRTFMPDCGPAAIAVHLSDSLSYCFDAGNCYLRYCWYGPFLQQADLWQRKGDEVAQVAGTLFFRTRNGFPIRMDQKKELPAVHFKGYTLKGPYPELHYQIGETDVYQTISPAPAENGVVQHFRIPHAKGPIRFLIDPSARRQIKISKGTWEKTGVRLTALEARDFSVSILKNPKKAL